MIEIIYYGEIILGENEWDLVVQLWVYFIYAFIQLKKRICGILFSRSTAKGQDERYKGRIFTF